MHVLTQFWIPTFYLKNLRSAEYATLFDLAFSALRFSDLVLVNAPFLKEIRDALVKKDKPKEKPAAEKAE